MSSQGVSTEVHYEFARGEHRGIAVNKLRGRSEE
jgi:hypothetical protein